MGKIKSSEAIKNCFIVYTGCLTKATKFQTEITLEISGVEDRFRLSGGNEEHVATCLDIDVSKKFKFPRRGGGGGGS